MTLLISECLNAELDKFHERTTNLLGVTIAGASDPPGTLQLAARLEDNGG